MNFNGNSQKLFAKAVGLVVAGLLLCSTAYAQTYSGADDKGVTGAQCVGAGGNPWGHYAIRPSGIQNVSDALRYVSCTLVTDAESTWSSADPAGNAYLYLVFNYSQGGGTTTCTVQLTDDAGTMVTYSESVSDPATPGLRKFMTFGPMTEGSASGRPISFNCLLPSMVTLTNINWEEYAATNNPPPAL